MTVITDSAGYSYIGNLQHGAYDINYPTFAYPVTGRGSAGMSSLMTTLLTNTGGSFSEVAADSVWNSATTGQTLFRWTPQGDSTANSTNKRLRFYIFNGRLTIDFLADNGTTVLSTQSSSDFSSWNTHNTSAVYPVLPKQFLVTASDAHIFLGAIAVNPSTSSRTLVYCYAQRFKNSLINQNYNYYFNSTQSFRYAMTAGGGFQHYAPSGISGTMRSFLTTGDAVYNIACSDSQAPTSQWITDWWLFDNNSTLGFPAVGKLLGVLRGSGTYNSILQPIRIQGSVFPDNGHNCYINGGTFASRTLLFRCYSS